MRLAEFETMQRFSSLFVFVSCLGLSSTACGGDQNGAGAGGGGASSATGGATSGGGSSSGGSGGTAAMGGSAGASAGGTSGSGTGASSGVTGGGGGGGSGGSASNMTPIFRMDCENSPLECNWGEQPAVNEYQIASHLADAGPAGQDVVRFTNTPKPASTGQVQYYLGWYGSAIGAPPPQGSTRYIRLWIRPIAPLVFDGTGDVWGDKFIILGDGNGEGGRVICNVRDGYPTSIDRMALGCYRNIDGGDHGTTVLLNNDQWNFVQIEVRSSTTAAAEDASIKMWLDSADYQAPTGSSTGAFSLFTSGWSNMGVGRYAGTAVATSGHVVFDVGGVEYDDEFDPGWVAQP